MSEKSKSFSQRFGVKALTETDIQQSTFENDLLANGHRKPFKHNVDRAITQADMTAMVEEVVSIEVQSEFHDFSDKWDDAVECAHAIIDASVQTCNDILSHKQTQARAVQRKEKARLQEEQKKMLKKIRDDAAAAAAAIKANNLTSQAKGLRPIFQLKLKSPDHIPEVSVLQTVQPSGSTWLSPFVLRNNDDTNVWLGDSKLQKALTKYAVEYPKALANESQSDGSGRHQSRLEDAAVIKCTQDFLSSMLCEQVDLSGIDGGTTFMSSLWFFGYNKSPKMSYCGFTPNCSATVKILALGKCSVLLIQTSSLVRVASQDVGPPVENLDGLDSIRDWDLAKLMAFAKAGVVMNRIEQQKGDLLYVPQGWIIVESSVDDEALIYGVRKSFIVSEEPTKCEYEEAMKLYAGSGRDTGRMQSILKLVKAQVGA